MGGDAPRKVRSCVEADAPLSASVRTVGNVRPHTGCLIRSVETFVASENAHLPLARARGRLRSSGRHDFSCGEAIT